MPKPLFGESRASMSGKREWSSVDMLPGNQPFVDRARNELHGDIGFITHPFCMLSLCRRTCNFGKVKSMLLNSKDL